MSRLVHLAPGDVFARDFRVVRPLNEGGMGAVYVVEQISTSNLRALKLMHPELVADARLRQRFEQEARIGARIKSDHIVQVVGAGVDEATQTPWLAMELLEGEDLAVLAARRGPLPPAEVHEIISQLCHGLGAAHAAGVVHRDLKPENVFLADARREGVPFTLKVLDLGIAKVVAEAQVTMTAAVGTPLWMAPEQTLAGAEITPTTDVWALGLIVFRLLTGFPYWVGANTESPSAITLLREVCIEPLAPATERAIRYACADRLPFGFDAWFARCVVRDPRSRFANAAEARAELTAVLNQSSQASVMATAPVAAPPIGGPAMVTAPAPPPVVFGQAAARWPDPAAVNALYGPIGPARPPFLPAMPISKTSRGGGGFVLWILAGVMALLVISLLGFSILFTRRPTSGGGFPIVTAVPVPVPVPTPVIASGDPLGSSPTDSPDAGGFLGGGSSGSGDPLVSSPAPTLRKTAPQVNPAPTLTPKPRPCGCASGDLMCAMTCSARR